MQLGIDCSLIQMRIDLIFDRIGQMEILIDFQFNRTINFSSLNKWK